MQKVEAWLQAFSQRTHLSARTLFTLDLVLNEALVNIINYGFDDDQAHPISINIEDLADELNVEITDDGRPFNPLENEIPELADSLENAPLGGRGILLLKNYCKDMNYCYSGGKNRLLMTISKQTQQ